MRAAEPDTTNPLTKDALLSAALVFVTLTCVYSLTYVGVFHSGDEHLFVSGAQSLGSWGSLSPGQAYSVRGLVYDVEPGLAMLGAALYQLARLPGIGGVHVLFLTNVYVVALTGSCVCLLARQQGCRPGISVAAALIFGLATLAWPHSKYYFRDPLATLFVSLAVLSFEMVFTRRRLSTQAAQWALTLALVAAGVLSKNTAVVLGPVLVVAALARAVADRRLRQPALVGPVMLLAAALILPVTSTRASLSPLTYINIALSQLNTPLNPEFFPGLVGALLSPGKGVFIESPVLLLALAAPFVGGPTRHWRKLLIPWLMTLGLALAVARVQDYLWWGGVGWGVRHMLPAVPLLTVAAAGALQAIWDRRGWAKGAVGALIVSSGLIQLGAVMAPPEAYYARLAGLAPGAAWTIAIWNPVYTEMVGYWQSVFEGQPWDFAWVRLLPDHPVRVVGLFLVALALLAPALIGLRRLQRTTGRRLTALAIGLACGAVSVLPYGLLRAYYPDPYYSAPRIDFRAAAEYLARNAKPGDAIVVRGYQHPLWYYFLNYARVPVQWYGIDAASPDPTESAELRARRAPNEALSEATVALLAQELPARYERVWLVNDFGAPGGEQHWEEWWLAQSQPFVRSEIFSDPGLVGVALFVLTPTATEPEQVTSLQFGDVIRLQRFVLGQANAQSVYRPGDTLTVELVWEPLRQPDTDYQVGVYLLDEGNNLLVQQDSAPLAGFGPTTGWPPGEAVSDRHALVLPDDLPAGRYRLAVALYDWRTGERLPAADATQALPQELADLKLIQVEAP